ncbi:MAG: hypothetical protein IBX70_08440 [Clostridia bacterium]|nr:hypothetical protein [Clostridia bacterium]
MWQCPKCKREFNGDVDFTFHSAKLREDLTEIELEYTLNKIPEPRIFRPVMKNTNMGFHQILICASTIST